MKEEYPRQYLYKRIVDSKMFIERHFAENIDLDSISREAHFSKFHFIRLFKETYGITPYQYLTQTRMEQAKKLLVKGYAISRASVAVGFESPSSFSGLFKRMFGIAPSDFQKSMILRQSELRNRPISFVPGCFVERNDWVDNSNFR